MKKEAGHSRLVGGGFNKQRKLHRRLILGDCMIRFSTPIYQNLRSLRRSLNWVQSHPQDSLTGLGRVHHTDGLNSTLLSQGWVLEQLPAWGRQAERTFPGQGWRRNLQLPRSGSQVNGQSHPPTIQFYKHLLH